MEFIFLEMNKFAMSSLLLAVPNSAVAEKLENLLLSEEEFLLSEDARSMGNMNWVKDVKDCTKEVVSILKLKSQTLCADLFLFQWSNGSSLSGKGDGPCVTQFLKNCSASVLFLDIFYFVIFSFMVLLS